MRKLMIMVFMLLAVTSCTSGEKDENSPEGKNLTPNEAEELAKKGVKANGDWKPFEQDFDGVTMVLVPAGCFMMGSTDEQIDYAVSLGGQRDWFTDEQPVNQQCFEQPFWIDKYEVTNGQFKRLGGVAANRSNWTDDNRPREQITWFESRDFCAKRGGRLPTEAEWEYAARGPDNLIFPWGNEFMANNVVYTGNSGVQTASVGSKPGGISWVGALDMSGNIWEWTSTIYGVYDYDKNEFVSIFAYPYNRGDGREENSGNRMFVCGLRGGSWFVTDPDIRAANRDGDAPDLWYDDFGFRCLRSY